MADDDEITNIRLGLHCLPATCSHRLKAARTATVSTYHSEQGLVFSLPSVLLELAIYLEPGITIVGFNKACWRKLSMYCITIDCRNLQEFATGLPNKVPIVFTALAEEPDWILF